jgi:hypothetical protein
MPLPLFRLALMAGAGYFFYNRYRNRGRSQTNASEAMDDIELGSNPHPEEVLDAGVRKRFRRATRCRSLPRKRPRTRRRSAAS